MCGIVGFIGNFDSCLLNNMMKYISHRGPDDNGQLLLHTATTFIGLGHQRLSIIDLTAHGHQPMTVVCDKCQAHEADDKEKIWLIFNGEIYNFIELRNQLKQSGHLFYSNTDSEVLIHLYVEYGLNMFKHVNGIFTIALYDGRKSGHKDGVQTGDVILVRDNVGVKPLYYASTSKGFLFASEMKAIVATGLIESNLDFTALDMYMSHLWCPAPKTLLRALKKAIPGEVMIIRNNNIYKSFVYQDLPQSQPIISKQTFPQLLNELNLTLENSVRRQLISDVPLGAFLSGGVDSSAIVAMASKFRPNMDCFTINVEGSKKGQDGFRADLDYARLVSKHLKVKLHEIHINHDMFVDLPKTLYHLDEPTADPAAINTHLICNVAKDFGIKVLLSGTGADDIFSGYRRHKALAINRYIDKLPTGLKHGIARFAYDMQSGKYYGMNIPHVRRLSKLFLGCNLSKQQRIINYFLWSTTHLRHSLYTADTVTQINSGSHQSLAPSLIKVSHLDELSQMLYLEQKHFLADHNLNYTDKMSMACGVEVRVPFLDQEMLQLAASVPSQYKMKGSITKYILTKAMEGILPQEVLTRSKTGFGAPVRDWFAQDSLVLEILYSDALARRGIFCPQALKSLVCAQKSGRVDAAYTLLAAACVELWLQIFIDRRHNFL
jgi:asparagine synthase (glutamine-hydrolysing)